MSTSISSVMYNKKFKNNTHETSNAFNDYFSNIVPELTHILPLA